MGLQNVCVALIKGSMVLVKGSMTLNKVSKLPFCPTILAHQSKILGELFGCHFPFSIRLSTIVLNDITLTTGWIITQLHRNDPLEVPYQHLIPCRILLAMATER